MRPTSIPRIPQYDGQSKGYNPSALFLTKRTCSKWLLDPPLKRENSLGEERKMRTVSQDPNEKKPHKLEGHRDVTRERDRKNQEQTGQNRKQTLLTNGRDKNFNCLREEEEPNFLSDIETPILCLSLLFRIHLHQSNLIIY